MAPLKLWSLERDFDIALADSSFRMFCASHDILTVEDFLVHDLYELQALAERDCKQETLNQGIRQIFSKFENKHMLWLNGMELIEDAEANKCTLSTGWERIDVLLQGGLHEGHVTELVGPSSSGKTQVCLKCASHVARNYSGMVMFFNTGNSLSAKRIAQFISQSSGPADIEVNKILQQVMSNIACYSIFDIFTLLDMLHQLKNNLKSQVSYQVRILIIDSLSSLIAPILGGGGAHGHALMLTAGYLLKELAHEHNLSVLVTNHTVAGEAGVSKPALGESWKSIPHVRLLLSPNHATNCSRISILKHPYLEQNPQFALDIPACHDQCFTKTTKHLLSNHIPTLTRQLHFPNAQPTTSCSQCFHNRTEDQTGRSNGSRFNIVR